MSPAALSVLALGVVILASFGARVNVGVLAIALAWPIATFAAGWDAAALVAVFPSSLFVTLLGVTLLFGIAQSNGTMAALTQRAWQQVGSRAALMPPLFFALACIISTMGPGAIATIALLAPLAMVASVRSGVPVLLTALMIGNGANAGNLSPFSAVGVIVAEGMLKAGVPGHAWSVWAANFAAHALAALAAWALFGGPQLRRQAAAQMSDDGVTFAREHRLTLVVGAAWVFAVVVFKAPLGFTAFAAAALLLLLSAGEDTAMLKQVPWSVLVMVTGVSVLVGVLEGTGGMDLFSSGLALVATPDTVNGSIAFITGAISTYSSTSGVVSS
jgi:di/tricarboxylate transporter